MKRKSLFIIFCIATLTLPACGKEKTPAMSNNVEIEATTVEEVEEITENVTIETEIIEDGNENITTTDNSQEETTEEQESIDVTLESQEQNKGKEIDVRQEVEDAMAQDPDAPDPSLSQEQLDLLDSMFSGEGSFGGQEPTYGETFNDGQGMEYYGGTEPW